MFEDSNIQSWFECQPDPYKEKLLALRQLILDVAEGNTEIGPLEESLKWSQASYVPQKPRVGTAVRIDRYSTDKVAIYVHCQTNLISDFKAAYPEMDYLKNRAIICDVSAPPAFYRATCFRTLGANIQAKAHDALSIVLFNPVGVFL